MHLLFGKPQNLTKQCLSFSWLWVPFYVLKINITSFFIESTFYARISRMSVVHPFFSMARNAKCRILKDTVGGKKQRKILGSHSEIEKNKIKINRFYHRLCQSLMKIIPVINCVRACVRTSAEDNN